MENDSFVLIEEELSKIRNSFKEIDSHIKRMAKSGDYDSLNSLRKRIERLSIVPPVSHSFTVVLNDLFSKSFKFQRIVNSSLMASMVSSRNRINSKAGGKDFCAELGCRLPKTYLTNASYSDVRKFDFSVIKNGFVLKPVFGAQSKNVHGLLQNKSGVVKDVFSGKTFSSIDHALTSIAQNSPSGLKWEVEELILNSEGDCSYDVKFYTFYGKVVLVLQVNRWEKRREDVFFDRNGNLVQAKISRYYRSDGKIVNPLFNERDIELVEKLSTEIPFPFCRIDFLAGREGLYFGELTFNAGGAGSFYDEWDKVLGEEFVLAKNRLILDLLNNKEFKTYKKISK
ncbi:ATP-grasp fold amidoligase family protein [Nitrincola alkalisediminis]|uniref:ATP-grasp fold amidoligase family protein n=1 Tax=Nitrincola alkalisediminis TaxID=1366656 RepID=UPI001874710C|nr:ATP-grasp fold amidoligase family protein [Nitrincola alkalisediminis]